jgi:hypothetical protein
VIWGTVGGWASKSSESLAWSWFCSVCRKHIGFELLHVFQDKKGHLKVHICWRWIAQLLFFYLSTLTVRNSKVYTRKHTIHQGRTKTVCRGCLPWFQQILYFGSVLIKTINTSIIIISYLMIYRIWMQICVHDAFAIRLSSFACHNTVSYHDTTSTSLFINCIVDEISTTNVCIHGFYGSVLGVGMHRG